VAAVTDAAPPRYRTPLPGLLAGLLETALNRLLTTDPASLERLQRLQGRLLEVQLEGLGITLYLAFSRWRVAVQLSADRPADAVVSGSPPALFALALADRDDGWAGPGSRVRIAGDATLARDLERLFAQLEPDWEGELAIWFGDVFGHQAAVAGRAAAAHLRDTAEVLHEWSAEYLGQPQGPVAQAAELQEFSAAVDHLRDATDRLEARLRRLRDRRAGSAGTPAP